MAAATVAVRYAAAAAAAVDNMTSHPALL